MAPLLPLLLLANMAQVASVVLFGWSATSLLLLYWGENAILGFITFGKMAAAGFSKGVWSVLPTSFYLAFFIFHYGIFCAVHATLIFVFTDPIGEPELPELLPLILSRVTADFSLYFNLGLLAAFHFFNFIAYWLIPGRWRQTNPRYVMFQPYGRIVVVHLALLFGGLAAQQLGQPVIVVAALALLKSLLEAATYGGEEITPASEALAKRLQ